MLLSDDDSDDQVIEGGIEQRLGVKNEEESSAGCGREKVNL